MSGVETGDSSSRYTPKLLSGLKYNLVTLSVSESFRGDQITEPSQMISNFPLCCNLSWYFALSDCKMSPLFNIPL